MLPGLRPAIAAGGLIAYALAASWMGVDLAESLTPEFHSSIYGLLILGGQWMAALGFGLVLGLFGKTGRPGFAAAGAYAVALLMWAYLHAMQFIVIWSGDIPEEVGWYLARGTGGWAVLTAFLFLIQGLAPFFALLSPSVRSSRNAMIAIGLVTLAMRPVESAWLLLPGQPSQWAAAGLGLVALIAMGGFGAALVRFVDGRSANRRFAFEP